MKGYTGSTKSLCCISLCSLDVEIYVDGNLVGQLSTADSSKRQSLKAHTNSNSIRSSSRKHYIIFDLGCSGLSVYCATKHAIEGFTQVKPKNAKLFSIGSKKSKDIIKYLSDRIFSKMHNLHIYWFCAQQLTTLHIIGNHFACPARF